ncbi:unnamed protein product (macronuclear) [Paramecium tetraurelia]|uniref:Uncharacterized protein n=1 Tax=Paramecium tetraurelia TaxID=5888 RepID=A0CMQ4_PARTE|nr:uncharacterized protein GSPATT00008550001 [Paramecium tetraurelia]CAK72071.1 unnamed protein product [Paramecium tetraurelia]|eukprot:XP_001439468.1 hypothetical protein (macronuclear) [Paramecium tetraurelia strain d4-2]
MSSNRLKEMRENFHQELRKKNLESVFRLKRLVNTPKQSNPVEKLTEIVNKMMRSEELQDYEYQTINVILDEIDQITVTDTSLRFELSEQLSVIKSLVGSLEQGSLNTQHINIAIKAANCYRNLTLQQPQIDQYDQVQNILASLQMDSFNEQALKLLATITKNIENDNQVITILTLASRLIDTCDSNLREKGLNIFENASRNKQNIQYILSMSAISAIIDFVYINEKNIQKISMTILVNLSYTSDFHECAKLLDLGITDVVYKLLKNSIFTYSRIFGSMIFNNLMASSHLLLDKVISNLKLLQLVFDLLENDVFDVRIELFQAFRNFLVVCTNQQLQNLIDNGILDYLTLGLDDHDNEIILIAVQTLYQTMKRFISTDSQYDIYYKFQLKNIPKKLEKLQQNDAIYDDVSQFIEEFYDEEFDDYEY